jgi:prepilin-type N-terminal cleavage/methylation domain-containing protein
VVRRETSFGRAAFTMIELIFAIVIVSIAVISLPTMIQITSKGIESNIVQEAIFAASAELMGATSYYWDAKSMEDNETSRLSRVIDVDNDCEDNASSPRYRLRDGHIAQPYHRRCLNDKTVGIDGNPSTDFPNINNFTGGEIFDINVTEASGYKDIYTSSINVAYVDETGATNNNIKKITTTITNSKGETIIKLNTYSANIGEIDYYKRRF